jgi:hypothetical protein
MVAYREVDGWVRSWSVPDLSPEAAAAFVEAAGGRVGGVHVQLRLDGLLVGRGQALVAAGKSPVASLLTATRDAMLAAESRMQLPNDAMRDAALLEQASRLMISLELAGQMIAFDPATWAEAELMLSPGLEGVAVMIHDGAGGTGELHAAFPSMLITTNTLPHRALGGLCASSLGEGGAAAALDQPQQIRSRHGVRMYRFRTTHLAQCKPGAEPVFLFRGARLIDQSEMTAAELRRMADRMVMHMVATQAGHLGRTYLPGTGTYSGSRPLKESIALRLVALRAYMEAAQSGASLGAVEQAQSAWTAAATWSHSAAGSFDGDADAAMFLQAIAAPRRDDADVSADGDSDPAADAAGSVRWVAGRSWSDGRMLDTLSKPVRSVAALAYAKYPASRRSLSKGESEARTFEEHEIEIRNWVATVPHGEFVSHMPWLGWAEVELAKRKAEASGQSADIPSAIALREMRQQVWEHQVGAVDIDEDSLDLAGGIVFTKGASPLPTWQCTRPLAFIATMLADARLTEPKERNQELGRLLHALRFIRQLQVDESVGWMAPKPGQAVGGFRAAPWDHSMPPDATSMALLVVVETLKSLETLSEAAKPTAAEPAAPAGVVP